MVIGASPAGVVAAVRAAELRARTSLIASREFGGMADKARARSSMNKEASANESTTQLDPVRLGAGDRDAD